MGRRLYYLTRDCLCIAMASSTSHSLAKFESSLTISKEEEQHIKLGSNLTSKYESSTSTLANKEVARRRRDIGRVALKDYEHFTIQIFYTLKTVFHGYYMEFGPELVNAHMALV